MKQQSMADYIDLHSHILFSVDDGSNSLDISLAMLETAYQEGIRTIACTPHYHPAKCTLSHQHIEDIFEQFKNKALKALPNMRLILGREIFYTSDVPELLERGDKLMIGDTPYVLIEFDPMSPYQYLRSGIQSIRQTGYFPILAHVERYMCLVDNWELIEELKNLGAVIQVNAGAVTGNAGRAVKKFIKKLMKAGLVDIIATDAHSNGRRAPRMLECAKYVIKRYGTVYAEQLLHDNAETILSGEYLED
jgi:protein-tyrosine phosphatase